MIFILDGLVYDPEIIYIDDTPRFTFSSIVNDSEHKKTIGYWSIVCGGHQQCIINYRNGRLHGSQYGWYSIQEGGHQLYIENYKNGQKHGIQQYYGEDKSYYTEMY
jgi:antitoxin component YwqK of YwqJK toxin-antitoxin module